MRRHLVARAMRPSIRQHAYIDCFEIALNSSPVIPVPEDKTPGSEKSPPAPRMEWRLFSLDRDGKPVTSEKTGASDNKREAEDTDDWHHDLTLVTQNKKGEAPDGDVYKRGWERIEFFDGGADPVGSSQASKPVMSFDPIAEDVGRSNVSVKSAFVDGKKKRLTPPLNSQLIFDTSKDGVLFLVATLHLRSLTVLGRLSSGTHPGYYQVLPAQIILRLSEDDDGDGAIEPDFVFRDGSLCLYELLLCIYQGSLFSQVWGTYHGKINDVVKIEDAAVTTLDPRNIGRKIAFSAYRETNRAFFDIARYEMQSSPDSNIRDNWLAGDLKFIKGGEDNPSVFGFYLSRQSDAGFGLSIAGPLEQSRELSHNRTRISSSAKDFIVEQAGGAGQTPYERLYTPRKDDPVPINYRLYYFARLTGRDFRKAIIRYNERIGRYHQSLINVDDGSPVSFLPSLIAENLPKSDWLIAFAASDRVSNTSRLSAAQSQRISISAGMTQPLHHDPDITLQVALRGVATVSGSAIRFTARLMHPHRRINLESALKDGVVEATGTGDGLIDASEIIFTQGKAASSFSFFAKWNDEAPVREEELVRMGALDLQPAALTDNATNSIPPVVWTLSIADREESIPPLPGGSDQQSVPAHSIYLNGDLLVHAEPGTQDRFGREILADVTLSPHADAAVEAEANYDASFEREPAIVVDLDGDARKADTDFNPSLLRLLIAEAAYDGRSHNLTLSLALEESRQDTEERELLVIDREPFGIYFVQAPSLPALASPESNVIAVWSGAATGSPHWRFSEDPDGVAVALPPQGLGEAMEKSRGGALGDPIPGLPVDARYSPHARLYIDPSFEKRRFGEAPWNTRRLFGTAHQRSPGSRLTGFDLELLYGLWGEARLLSNMLIAESESRLGRVRGRQKAKLPWTGDRYAENADQTDAHAAARRRWARIRKSIATRLGVLEVWREGQADSDAVIADGLTHRMRKTAKLRFPIQADASEIAKRGHLKQEFFTSDGLSGGWSWGFTSLNVLDAVLRRPKSTSSFIVGPKFTAYGGMGYLKASFDENRSSIYADVSLGRLSFYSLERIGRIGNCHNRCKHVIVYERRVTPSRQFEHKQDPHLGRMIMRKVAEYIEILEPYRRYPERDNVPPSANGCVLGMKFKSIRIPVDSDWGRDVGTIGWTVPLWNVVEGAAKPDVYPKPVTLFRLAADPASDPPEFDALCDEPEKLVFYTDTREGTGADTDAWDMIPGVDFDPTARPATVPNFKPSAGKRINARKPADRVSPAGLDRFTYVISAGEREANVMAARGNEPISASLRSITMMRALPGSSNGASNEHSLAINQAIDGAERLNADIERIADEVKTLLAEEGNPKTRLEQLKAKATQHLDAFNAAMGNTGTFFGYLKGGEKICDRMKEVTAASIGEVKTRVGIMITQSEDESVGRIRDVELALSGRLHRLAVEIKDNKDKIRAEANAAKSIIDELTGHAGDAITNQFAALYSTIGGAEKLGDEAAGAVGLPLDKTAAAIHQELNALEKRASRLEQEIVLASRPIGQAFSQLRRFRQQARQELSRAAEMLERAERQISAEGNKLGQLADTALSHARALRAALSVTAERVDALCAAGLAAEPNAERAKTALLGAVRDINAVLDANGAIRKGIETAIEKIRDEVQKKIDEISDQATGYLQQIKDQIGKVQAFIDGNFLAVLKNMQKIEAQIEAILGSINDGADDARDALIDLSDKLAKDDGEVDGRPIPSARLRGVFNDFRAEVNHGLDSLNTSLSSQIDAYCQAAIGEAAHLIRKFDITKPAIEKRFDDLKTEIEDEISTAKARLETFGNELIGEATTAFEEVQRSARSFIEKKVGEVNLDELGLKKDAALRLARAFGDPPQLPKLDFNRMASAYIFSDGKDAVDITPMTAYFDQVDDDLKTLSIQLPTRQILDRVLPVPELPEIDLNKIIPDIGGIRIDKMFANLKTPGGAGNPIDITHGLDKQRQRAWAEAKVDLDAPGSHPLFDIGSLAIEISNPSLDAHARLEGGLDGSFSKQSSGALTGSWQLMFAGTKLATFRDTAIRFDDSGKFKFEFSPDKIEMDRALKYLSDLIATLNYKSDSGFYLKILERGGLPYGVIAGFDLALPDLAFGAVTVTGLSFGAFMRVLAYPEFVLEMGLNFSRKKKPFIITVFMLGGGGWLESRGRYLPFRNELTASVSIGIAVAAELAFNFGPINGGVRITLGLSVEFYTRPGSGGGKLDIVLTLLVVGQADVLGLITVGVMLMLEARYSDSGAITASGELRVSARISRFFKIEVQVMVTYDFKSGSGTSETRKSVEAPEAADAARELIGMMN